MTIPRARDLFRRHIALTQEHGSWVFLLSPLLIGFYVGRKLTPASGFLVLAALAVFLIRQPITVSIKVYSGRRSKRDLPAAGFWIAAYGTVGLIAVAGLIAQGHAYLLYLAVPGVPVFLWHLYLVSQRAERRKLGVELVASGVLALAAPAAFWVAMGEPDPTGWLLWGLTWMQSAASIVYATMRLEQRDVSPSSSLGGLRHLARRSLLFSSFNLAIVGALSVLRVTPPLLPIPYLLQWSETIWGILRPAAGLRPTAIGVRQLVVSTLFTLLFIVTWR